MNSLIREETYILYLGTERFTLSIQELVWGLEPWPEKFRVQIPGTNGRKSTLVYGSTVREAAEKAAEYLSMFGVAHTPLMGQPEMRSMPRSDSFRTSD